MGQGKRAAPLGPDRLRPERPHGAETHGQEFDVCYRDMRTLASAGWRDPEHHRSVATLASRLCGKVFGFVKENLSGAQRRKDAAS